MFMFEFSDAWFLTSLILLKKWSSIKEIISTGDMINHAIFNESEIDNAIRKLQSFEYIETDGKNWRATKKAFELSNCSSFRRAGLFTMSDVILKRLNT